MIGKRSVLREAGCCAVVLLLLSRRRAPTAFFLDEELICLKWSSGSGDYCYVGFDFLVGVSLTWRTIGDEATDISCFKVFRDKDVSLYSLVFAFRS